MDKQKRVQQANNTDVCLNPHTHHDFRQHRPK